jgi:hypothetical protein
MSSPFVNQLNTSAQMAHQSSIEIAVDQRQLIGKARQIGAKFVPIFKRMAPFVQADVERFCPEG